MINIELRCRYLKYLWCCDIFFGILPLDKLYNPRLTLQSDLCMNCGQGFSQDGKTGSPKRFCRTIMRLTNWSVWKYTVSSHVYAQSISSQIRMKVGVGVIPRHDSHWVTTDLKWLLIQTGGCTLSRTEHLGARIQYIYNAGSYILAFEKTAQMTHFDMIDARNLLEQYLYGWGVKNKESGINTEKEQYRINTEKNKESVINTKNVNIGA